MERSFAARFAALCFAGLSLASCAIKPEPLTPGDVSTYASDKLARVSADQEPVGQPIGLYEAMARALKYNLDAKVELAQTALKLKELDLSEFKMLPSLVANSGYAGRSNVAASVLQDLSTQRIGTTYTTASPRDSFLNDVTLSWNVLDFGLSYVRAQQIADEALIAEEMRRKVAIRVIEDVRTAYWRAVTYQRLIARLRGLESRAERARGAARRLYSEGQTQPMLALAYERELVEIRREIQKVEGELVVAKDQLSALINIAPGTPYSLVDSRSSFGSSLALPHGELVRLALENRPEMHEVQYKQRINQKEATAALLELLPGAQLYFGGNVDSNKFLLHNHWLAYGAKASWNLMKAFQYPARKSLVDAQDSLLDQRALAVTMAIMTQVHVSQARYHHAARELKTAADYLNVQNDILAQIRAQAAVDRTGEQSLIREEMNSLLAEVKFDLAHAQLQNAFGTIYSAVGLDPVDANIDLNADVRSVAGGLSKLWRARGQTVGVKTVGLLRAARRPKPSLASPMAPMGGASVGAGSALLAPAPAPGSTSRSLGGSFLTPSPVGAPAGVVAFPPKVDAPPAERAPSPKP